MIYLFPVLLNTMLTIMCLSCGLQALSHFSAIHERLQNLSNADAEWMACAQRKANLLNIAESYAFLLTQKPHLLGELLHVRQRFESPLMHHPRECAHALFPNIQASAKKQNPRSSYHHWPNWIFAADEVRP